MSDEQQIDDAIAFQPDSGFVTADSETSTAAGSEDSGGMDQLRGLVLGPVVDELQMKMTQLSQRLDGSMLELDRRTSDRVSELETRFTDRLDAMASEVTELRERQAATLKEVRDEMESGARSLNQKMDELSQKLVQERTAEVEAIRAEFEQLSNSIGQRLECETNVLRSELVDRDSLSAALSEVALRLSSESEIIGADTGQVDMEMDLEAAIDAVAGK